MGIFNPTKPPKDGSPLSAWLDHLVAWLTSERVFIQGWTMKQTAHGKFFTPPNIPPQNGIKWQQPKKELDPTVSVSAGTLVEVSPNNPLVTTGLTDLVTTANLKSVAGIYYATKNIPAKTSSGYNVPNNPVYGAPGGVTGSPLSGDFDAANVYWLPIGGGSGGTFADFYDNTVAYSSGAVVQIVTTTTVGGVTILPGTYILRQGLSTAAMATGNQVPQYPYPHPGTIYWLCISMGISVFGDCSSGTNGTAYVNSSGIF